MKRLLATIAITLSVTAASRAASDCEKQKDRFMLDYIEATRRGVEASGKMDDAAYCKSIKDALATAQAYYDWARQSGCLAGDAAARERALQSIKELRDRSQKDGADDCR